MGQKLSKCIVCGNGSFEPYCSDVVRCLKCNLVVAEEIPTKQEVKELYQKEYFFGMEYSDYEADRVALEHNFRKRIKRLNRMIWPEASVVEVGCAYGYFLNLVKERVDNHIGFDVAEEGVAFAKKLGVNATNDDFIKWKFKQNSVDSIFMWDVVEHLSFPEDYIKKISTILKPGGRLALTTGDISALVPRLRKGKWRMIHPPTHVYYFSSHTITQLLNDNDLRIESIKYKSVSRNIGSVLKQLIANSKAKNKNATMLIFVSSLFEKTRLDKLNVPLNTFDIMEVVAEKV